jgi:hypothetical protein
MGQVYSEAMLPVRFFAATLEPCGKPSISETSTQESRSDCGLAKNFFTCTVKMFVCIRLSDSLCKDGADSGRLRRGTQERARGCDRALTRLPRDFTSTLPLEG